MELDILEEIGVSDTGKSEPAPEVKKTFKPSGDKVNMYDVEIVKAMEIDTDKFDKTGHTFMVHVFGGGGDTDEVEEQILKVATKLKDKGYIFRCDAPADDTIGNKLASMEGLKKEVYLPFKKFNENLADSATMTNKYELAYRYAAQIYGKRYNDLKPGARAVYAAKLLAALGIDGDNPVDFLICYSPDGREHLPGRENKERIDYTRLGTLSFYLRLCQQAGIPVYNFKNKDSLITFVSNYLKPKSEED